MLIDEIKEIFAKPFSDIDKIMLLEDWAQEKIRQVKQQYAEEVENIIQEKQEVEVLLEKAEKEYSDSQGRYEGYRQAVKDIFGGTINE